MTDNRTLGTIYRAYLVYTGREDMKRKHPSAAEFESILEFLEIYRLALDELTKIGGEN
jgi:hypothetical protein